MVNLRALKFHKTTIVYFVLSLVLHLAVSEGIYGENPQNTGYKYFKNYHYREYDHHPQNYCILQDKEGIIYVGNNGGVLVYDGVTWKLIEVPNKQVSSMALAANGRIYIGGRDEFGYLAPDDNGFLQYNSLRHHLDKKYGSISTVRNTIATHDGVYFRTRRLFFRWNYKETDIHLKGGFGILSLCDGTLLLQKAKTGLLKVEKDSLTPLPGSGILGTTKIFILLPYSSGAESRELLLGIPFKGLSIFKEGTLTPFSTEADDYFKTNTVFRGIRLSNGDYAVVTIRGGLVMLRRDGSLKYIFNKTRGLQDNSVKSVFEDNMGNLWLPLMKGISRLECRSPFDHYDDTCGLGGVGFTVTRHKGDLYVGTSRGVYALSREADSFSPIASIRNCRNLLSYKGTLLAAAWNGVHHIDTSTGKHRKISTSQTYRLQQSFLFPGHVWCASKKGLYVLGVENDNWAVKHRYDNLKAGIQKVAESPDGDLWLLMSTGNLLKLNFPHGITQPVPTQYESEDKLYEGNIEMAVLNGHMVFASQSGIFRYDKKTDTFVPDRTLGEEYAYSKEAKPVYRIVQDRHRTIWFHSQSRNYRATPTSKGTYTITCGPFRRIPFSQVNRIYPDPDGEHIWFTGAEGLSRFDCNVKVKWNMDFPAVIRSTSVNDTPVFGAYRGDKTGKSPVRIFPYKDRDISFQCSAPFFERESDTMYRYRLDGYTPGWSAWTSEWRKGFTNLDAGRYTFGVQGKNIYGTISREDTFEFDILPPWYQTWWAFVLYGIGGILFFYLALRWRSGKLIKEKKRLEQVVKERTKEIREKNTQLEHQTLQVREQAGKLMEMGEAKSRFFANISHEFRTPLTLIMSPLEQMLSRKQAGKQSKIYQIMLRNSQRLLRLVNQLLELSRFDGGKTTLSASRQDIVPLLKGEIAAFSIPAEQRGIKMTFRSPEVEVLLYFDAEKMEEVMVNLLANALKCTLPGGEITMALSLEKTQPSNYARISVKDTGIGIPKTQLGNVFDRFFQTGGAKTSKGTGIGLALSREIVLLHHGTIDVFSEEGKGTEFILRLPMGKNHLTDDQIISRPLSRKNAFRTNIPPAGLQPKHQSAHNVADTGDDGDNDYKNADTTDSAPGNQAGRPEETVILVAEDHEDMRHYIRQTLEPLYKVIESADGKDAVAKAKEFIPDLIVSDIMMPEPDGYQLCRTLKTDIKTCHIPIILLTAKASEDSIVQGLETGADDYITKPFSTDMLCARIKNLIQLRRQLQLKIQREKMLLPSNISISSQDDQFLSEFQEIINYNLGDQEFNVEILCGKLLISRNTLFRKIKALTGETPNQFIQSYRLERGAQMLRENFGNVTEVAFAVGFSSSQYFSSCFKEKFHQSPKSYQISETKSGSTGKA
ncbi:MAG: response regulator [bacterium]|nr:response regulator [bacterium]